MGIQLSIIIINYNTKRITNNCINSIIEHTLGIHYEIIVVDNNSTDGSKELLENNEHIKYIYLEKNYGFGKANNVGMRAALGKYILLLNSDTLFINNAALEFYKHAESNNFHAVYGAHLVNAEYQNSTSCFPFTEFSFWKHIFRKRENKILYNSDAQEIDAICGADMFFPKKIFDLTKGFDENLFLYGEDEEWQYRMSKLNIPRYIISGPKIIHLEGKSMSNLDPLKMVLKYRSLFYIMKKHCTTINYILFRLYYAINIGCRTLPKSFRDYRYRKILQTALSPKITIN